MQPVSVRIVGPSYCGSTALGCAMNTGHGFFFGSEMRRLLRSTREARSEGRFGHCDFCGRDCRYWSPELYDELEAEGVDSLPDLYRALTRRHPRIKRLVDGSKTVPEPGEARPDFIVIPVKHPLRLIASHIYNRRADFGIASEGLEPAGLELESGIESTLPQVEARLMRLHKDYRNMFHDCAGAFVFRTDEAHLDNFAIFRDLERHLGVPLFSFNPMDFSMSPSHTIGGNRAPVWITKDAHGHATPVSARKDYYSSASTYGDWKLDNKHELLIRPRTLEALRSLDAYVQLCELLDYPALPA